MVPIYLVDIEKKIEMFKADREDLHVSGKVS
jgi:hypothetical protein